MRYFECQPSIPAGGTGQMSSPGSGKEGWIVGEVSTERTEKAGLAGVWFLVAGRGGEDSRIFHELSARNPMRAA